MSRVLLLQNFGKLSLSTGAPPGFSAYVIPAALHFHAKGRWGVLFLQEIKTPKYFLRHFFFSLKQSISFFSEESNNNLQSLLSVNGHFDFQLPGQEKVELKKKEYLLFINTGQEALTTAYKGHSSILNAQYAADFYQDLLPYFTSLKKDLQKAIAKSHFFIHTGKIERRSVNNAIKAIWEEKYIPALQAKHIELHLESTLFGMFAESFDAKLPVNASPQEKNSQTK